MKKLEEIGFYTLSDERAKNTSSFSPLYRSEIIVTDICNFRCPYCRGVLPEYRGNLPQKDLYSIINLLT